MKHFVKQQVVLHAINILLSSCQAQVQLFTPYDGPVMIERERDTASLSGSSLGTLVATDPHSGEVLQPSSAIELAGHDENDQSLNEDRFLARLGAFIPTSGATIGKEYTFQAYVAEPQGLAKVYFWVKDKSTNKSFLFQAKQIRGSSTGGRFQVSLSGFTDGPWSWKIWVQNSQGALSSTGLVAFTVQTSTGNSSNNSGSSAGNDSTIVAGLQPSCSSLNSNAFNVCLDLKGDSGKFESWMPAFGDAVTKWQSAISGDVPPSIPSAQLPTSGTVCTKYPQIIDDLYICGSTTSIDGLGGILGAASPEFLRTSNSLPITGYMRFDSADVANQQAKGTYLGLILHEMGHVLGIGTLWERFGLYDGSSGQYKTGTYAAAEWRAIGCTGPLPVETDGGQGTAGGHWDEQCVTAELMTGFSTGTLPMSRITLGSLQDLGYTVNYDAADSFGVKDLGVCGSYCPAAGQRRRQRRDSASTKTSLLRGPDRHRKLSDQGLAKAQAFAHSMMAKYRTGTNTENPTPDVEYVGDRMINVLYEEDGHVYDIHFDNLS